MDDFTRGYIECALWAETWDHSEDGGNDESFEAAGYGADDIAPEALKQLESDCADFQEANAADLEAYCTQYGSVRGEHSGMACAGHDFWFTRNGHGAGFWDRGLGALGERLSAASKAYGSCNLYLGDDGLIYQQ